MKSKQKPPVLRRIKKKTGEVNAAALVEAGKWTQFKPGQPFRMLAAGRDPWRRSSPRSSVDFSGPNVLTTRLSEIGQRFWPKKCANSLLKEIRSADGIRRRRVRRDIPRNC